PRARRRGEEDSNPRAPILWARLNLPPASIPRTGRQSEPPCHITDIMVTPTTPQTAAGQRLGEKRQALVPASGTRYRKVLDPRESEVGPKSAKFAASARVK